MLVGAPSRRKLSRRLKPAFTRAYLAKWFRVMNNISSAMGIIITGIIVLLLLSQGMFKSTHFSSFYQEDWTPYYQMYRLNGNGFIHSTCHKSEWNITTQEAWKSIGIHLAKELEITRSVYVTTCCIIGDGDSPWGSIVLLVGDTEFPSCNPQGSQEIIGMMALDTVGTDKHPTGAYLLTTFSDTRPIDSTSFKETLGGEQRVTKSISKSIIIIDGEIFATSWTQRNYVTSLNSLNRFFLMQVWVVPHSLDISATKDTLMGYSIGKTSRFITTIGWDVSHQVDNYLLLLLFQILICLVTLSLLSNDGIITLEGLSGLLKNKPVLTYDIMASFERRRILLLSLIGTFLFSPLYADALRYNYYINGHHYWSLTLLMIGLMMSLSWIFLLRCCQSIPAPTWLRNRPISYCAPVFAYCNSFTFIIYEASISRGSREAAAFWTDATPTLCLTIHGKEMTAGAYDMDGTTPIIYALMPDIIIILFISWVVSIVAQKIIQGNIVLDMTWTHQNTFINQLPMPQWVTSLDLDKKNTITIGTKLYCKPSLMVLLGYCTVHDISNHELTADLHVEFSSNESSCTDSMTTENSNFSGVKGGGKVSVQPQSKLRSSAHEIAQYTVVSIYDLVFATVSRLRQLYQPRAVGVIQQNNFRPSKSTTTLESERCYVYSRGDCCT